MAVKEVINCLILSNRKKQTRKAMLWEPRRIAKHMKNGKKQYRI